MNIAVFAIQHIWLLLPLFIVLGLVVGGIKWLVARILRQDYSDQYNETTDMHWRDDGWWNPSKGGSDPYDK